MKMSAGRKPKPKMLTRTVTFQNRLHELRTERAKVGIHSLASMTTEHAELGDIMDTLCDIIAGTMASLVNPAYFESALDRVYENTADRLITIQKGMANGSIPTSSGGSGPVLQ
jgi:hypothetical protein